MVRITKVYTRSGDKGDTGLVGGKRIPKDHPRIGSYGTVDELNSIVGLCRSFLAQKESSVRRDKLDLVLEAIQQKLFDMGSELATLPGTEYEGQITLQPEDAEWLEEIIDAMNEDLEPLQSFILPGGTPLNAFLHQARTVCRRAERCCVALCRAESAEDQTVVFLNRLSDLLFAMARSANQLEGVEDVPWKGGATDQSR